MIKKILYSLMITFLLIAQVHAEEANEIIIEGGNLHYISAASCLPNVDTTDGANDGQNLSLKLTKTGDAVYCISPDKLLYDGTLTYQKGTKLNNKIVYVLENGYPQKSITGDNDKDYFITNLAIWYLMEPTANKLLNYNFANGTYKGANSDTVVKANNLIVAANAYTPVTNYVSVSQNMLSMTLSEDRQYYVSPSINVTLSGNSDSYTVTLNNPPTGTKIMDTSGNEKTTFDKNSSFIIKVPASSVTSLEISFDVSITATFSIKEAYSYTPVGHDTQAVVKLVENTETKSTGLNLSISNTNEVKISKQDATTGEELPGATLIVTNSSGTEIARWVSTTTPYTIKNLEPGEYTLTEISAPKKYVLNKQSIKFTVKSDGTVNGPVIMKNYPDEAPKNPQTGSTLFIIFVILGVLSFTSVVYYTSRTVKE